MNDYSDDQIRQAVVKVISEVLFEQKEAQVPGLGKFYLHHYASEIISRNSSVLEITPPKDEVRFAPDRNPGHASAKPS